MSPESVADLVDLEQELSSIQRGITQMERITPSEPIPSTKLPTEEDPFGDSFTNFPVRHLQFQKITSRFLFNFFLIDFRLITFFHHQNQHVLDIQSHQQ